MPLVSIIIPAYNAERWLPETLGSVAQQDLSDAEVIIINDGSTDGTAAYVTTYWPQFRLVTTENKGVSHARNLGTTLSSGEFIQYLDADDLLMPGKIARHQRLLQAQPEADVVYANWQNYEETETGRYQPAKKIRRTIQDVAPDGDAEMAFFSTLWCPTGAYFYRREFLQRVLPWKEWLPVVQDARFALDCAMAGARWIHDEEVSVLYRVHQQGSVSTRSRLAFLRDCVANTLDIEHQWRERSSGSLTAKQEQAVIGVLSGAAWNLYQMDRPLFEKAFKNLRRISPTWLPQEPRMACWLSKAFGFRTAAAIASWFRH